MEMFWFYVYMVLVISSLMYHSVYTLNDLKTKGEVGFASVIAAIFVVAVMTFSYHAGIFYTITGYAGNSSLFLVWLTLVTMTLGYRIFKFQLKPILNQVFSLFVIYMMGGLSQLQIFVG